MEEPRFAEGLGGIEADFDGFLVDQWGVLHDGVTAYPGARECLARLAALGKRVVVLSNSGRRAAPNAALLTKIGFSAADYTAMVSSGEVVWQAFRDRTDPYFAELGRRCLLFSRHDDRSVVEGLDLELVATAGEAAFILVSGSEAPEKTLADYEGDLRQRVKTIATAWGRRPARIFFFVIAATTGWVMMLPYLLDIYKPIYAYIVAFGVYPVLIYVVVKVHRWASGRQLERLSQLMKLDFLVWFVAVILGASA